MHAFGGFYRQKAICKSVADKQSAKAIVTIQPALATKFKEKQIYTKRLLEFVQQKKNKSGCRNVLLILIVALKQNATVTHRRLFPSRMELIVTLKQNAAAT